MRIIKRISYAIFIFRIPFMQWNQAFETNDDFKGLRAQKEIFDILGKCAALNKYADQVRLTLTR